MTRDHEPRQEARETVVEVYRCILTNEYGELLLIQRARTDRWEPGSWEVPGGKREPGQTAEEALVEEIRQETGLVVKPHGRPVCSEATRYTEGPRKGQAYQTTFLLGKSVGGQLKLSHEHSKCGWFRIEGALALPLTEQTRKALLALCSQPHLLEV